MGRARSRAQAGTGGFDEEATTIFFNKEDGVGIQELLDEVDGARAGTGSAQSADRRARAGAVRARHGGDTATIRPSARP